MLGIYEDGIQTSNGEDGKANNVVAFLFNIDPKLQRKPLGKIDVGYINFLTDMSKDEMVSYLKKKFNSETKARVEIQRYEQLIRKTFFESAVVHPINWSLHNGMQIHILGHGVRTVHVGLAAMIGDDVSLNANCGLLGSTAKHSCRHDDFPTRSSDEFSFGTVHKARNAKWTLDSLTLVQQFQRDELVRPVALRRGENTEERNILKQLAKLCVRPNSISPFLTAHFGFGHSIFDSSPTDILHTVDGGVAAAVKSWVLIIISLLNKSEDPKYKGTCARMFESAIRSFVSGYEDMPHVPWITFDKGLLALAERSGQKKDSITATGSMGGNRSSWARTMLLQILLVLGHSDDIVPNDPAYVYQVKVMASVPRSNPRGRTDPTLPTTFDQLNALLVS
jgi:hypothetical protein